MPTGYTAAVADGEITTLREFALTCARGMGALIMMRDEPSGASIPAEFAPDTSHHDEQLTELRASLAELPLLSDAEVMERQRAEVAEAEAYRADYLARKVQQRARYEAMIAKVEDWSTEAEGVRDFMLSQLRGSLKFDCGDKYEPKVPDVLSPGDWRAAKIDHLTKSIGYHETGRAEEIARTADRNRWLAALRASLPADETAEAV